MDLAMIQKLFGYYKWANQRVWDCVESVSEEQFGQEHDYSVGSLHNQMYHVMSLDWGLFYGIANEQKWPSKETEGYVAQEDLPTRAALRAHWETVELYMAEVLNGLSEERLDEMWTMPAGPETFLQASLRDLLYVTLNHGMNHRAQILALVHQLGGETAEMGFYYYLAETQVVEPAA